MSATNAQHYFIAYNPHLSHKFGSAIAAAIFQRFEYWANKMKAKSDGQGAFYKFIDACSHPCYKPGDSWCEELGISRKVFRNHFAKIGMAYKSKSDFLKKQDPFDGKYFAYYQDCKTNKTIFVRNHALLDAFYQQCALLLPQAGQGRGAAKDRQDNPTPSSAQPQDKGKPRDVPLVHSYTHMVKDKQITTSSLKTKNIKSPLSEKMITIWTEEIGQKGLSPLTDTLSLKLTQALKTHFKGELEAWRLHCQRIASSQFLMGEKPGTSFQIRLSYAISDRFIDELNEGKYELFTRSTKTDAELERLKHHLYVIEVEEGKLQSRLQGLKDQQESLTRQAINKAYEDLSAAELDTWKPLYEAHQRLRHPTLTLEAIWQGPAVEVFFEAFIRSKLREHVKLDPEFLRHKAQEEGVLQEKLNQIQRLKQTGLQARAYLLDQKHALG